MVTKGWLVRIAVTLITFLVGLSIRFAGNAKAQEYVFLPDSIKAVSWSPDEQLIAIGHTDGKIRLWNSETGSLVSTLEGHIDAITAITWRSDSLQLISSSADGTAKLWDMTNASLIHNFDFSSQVVGPIKDITWAGWNYYETHIITVEFVNSLSENRLKMWDTENYQVVGGSDSPNISILVWNSTGSLAVAANEIYTQLYDGQTLEGLDALVEPDFTDIQNALVTAVTWHPNDQLVASGSDIGWIRVWDVVNDEVLYSLSATDSPDEDYVASRMIALRFYDDGSELLSLTGDGTLRLWDMATGEFTQNTDIISTYSFAADISPDGRWLAYSDDTVLQFVDLYTILDLPTSTPN